MEQFSNLACPIGLCNSEIIQGGMKANLKVNEERETHSIDSKFFDILFDKVYDPMNIKFVNNTRKNRS